MTGGKRKNPVKTITVVEPKPHYPTAAFTASWPSPSPKKKKRRKIPSVWDLFISAFGWCSHTKGVCVLWPLMSYLFSGVFSSGFQAPRNDGDWGNLSFEHVRLNLKTITQKEAWKACMRIQYSLADHKEVSGFHSKFHMPRCTAESYRYWNKQECQIHECFT